MSEEICDRRITVRVKEVYKMSAKPVLMYGLAIEALKKKKRHRAEPEAVDMKMLKFPVGLTKIDRIRNKNIKETVRAEQFRDKVKKGWVRWFRRVKTGMMAIMD